MNFIKGLVGGAFAAAIFGGIAWSVLFLFFMVISEIKWPNTERKSGAPNRFGIYLRPTLGKEQERKEKSDFLDKWAYRSAIVCSIGAILFTLVTAFNSI